MSKIVEKPLSFRFLWIGQICANLGDVLYVVTLIKLIYDATGSVTYMSLVPFFNTMSLLFSGIVAPIFISKYKLKSILVYSQAGKTIFLFGLFLLVPYIQVKTLLFVYVIICFISVLDGWATPARNALVPSLVKTDWLVKTNSLLAISDQIVQLIAWPLGSIILAVWGGANILIITFVLFLISTILMGMINSSAIQKQEPKISKWDVLKEGWMIIWNSRQLRTISFMNILETFANAVWIAAIMYVFVSEVLKKGEQWWGFINGSFFAGMMISGILIYRFSNRLEKNLGNTILFSTVSLLVITFMFGHTSIPWFALLLSFLFGFPQMARDIAETRIIQKNAQEKLLAKVYSARATLLSAAFGLSSVLMGWVTEKYGVRTTFNVAAALFLLSFFIAMKGRNHLFMNSNNNDKQF